MTLTSAVSGVTERHLSRSINPSGWTGSGHAPAMVLKLARAFEHRFVLD
jgi:hypothetical protein